MNLAIYIHWPFCKSKCPYCDFNSHVREQIDQEKWRNALLAEMEFMHSHAADFTVSSIFFGGGTPSLMPPQTAEALINRVHELWKVADNVEITLEANPTSAEAQSFANFRSAGVNRLSLGVQSLCDAELKFLGRGHSANEAISAIKLAAKTFPRYSFDLIYARPNQTAKQWDEELSEALELAGGHLSLYQLTIEENTAFHHAYKAGGFSLPNEELAEELYILTEEKMLANGFMPYEISNYALVGEESRHNLSYWNGTSYIGIGAGAHGRINTKKSPPSYFPVMPDADFPSEHSEMLGKSSDVASSKRKKDWIPAFAGMTSEKCSGEGEKRKRIATQTLKSPERWLERVQKQGNGIEIWQEISPQDEVIERLMMGLRLRDGLNYADFLQQTGYDLQEHINLKKRDFYIEQGLLEGDKTTLKTTLKGRLLLNKLTAELLC